MDFAGYNVQLDVLNTTVAGIVQNSSLPSIQVLPPTAPSNTIPTALLMTLAVNSETLPPFNITKQRLVTGVLTQVCVLPVFAFVSVALCCSQHPGLTQGQGHRFMLVHANLSLFSLQCRFAPQHFCTAALSGFTRSSCCTIHSVCVHLMQIPVPQQCCINADCIPVYCLDLVQAAAHTLLSQGAKIASTGVTLVQVAAHKMLSKRAELASTEVTLVAHHNVLACSSCSSQLCLAEAGPSWHTPQ